MPCDYKKYPANWKTHIRPLILERAGNRCEGSPDYPDCRAENYKPHPVTGSRVVLTVAHMDQDIKNNDGMDTGGPAMPIWRANLRALCQRCHLNHDRKQRNLYRIGISHLDLSKIESLIIKIGATS